MSHTPTTSHRTSPLVVLSALAMFVFALVFGLAVMTGTKVHIEGTATALIVGSIIIVIGLVVAIGAIVTDRTG